MTEEERYAAAWRNRRKRWRLYWAWLAVFVVTLILWVWLDPDPSDPAYPSAMRRWSGIALLLGSGAAASAYVISFRCPRCGHLFYISQMPRADERFRPTCNHCRLPANTPYDEFHSDWAIVPNSLPTCVKGINSN